MSNTTFNNIKVSDDSGKLILPTDKKLRESYFSVLKQIYILKIDVFWFHEIINFISIYCGVDIDTAKKRAKQLVRFGLIEYISSSVNGHRYIVRIYIKDYNNRIYILDDFDLFCRIIPDQVPTIVEPDMCLIQKYKNKSLLGGYFDE